MMSRQMMRSERSPTTKQMEYVTAGECPVCGAWGVAESVEHGESVYIDDEEIGRLCAERGGAHIHLDRPALFVPAG